MVIALWAGSVSAATTPPIKEVHVPIHVTIGTIVRPPFVMMTAAAPEDTVSAQAAQRTVSDSALHGFSVELWRAIAERANITYQWRVFTQFSEMIDAARTGAVDAAIANISITAQRQRVADFSQPIYPSGLQILVPRAPAQSGWNFVRILWTSGVVKFIGFALAVLLVIAHILWFFERNVADKRHDYFRDDYFGGVWDAFWWAFIIMTMGGFENEVPHKKISRALAMLWIVVSLFFISTLTAKITTSLTVHQLASQIESVDDLVGKRVGVLASPTVRKELQRKGVRVVSAATPKELYAALRTGAVDAIVGDAPIMRYYATHEGRGTVRMAGGVFRTEYYGIIFPQGSALRTRVNAALLSLREDGTYAALRRRYFGE